MKIFEIRVQGEKEWVFADSLFQALKEYKHITGNNIDDFEDDDEIEEIPESQWRLYFMSFPDEDTPDLNFEDYVKELTTPAYMGSTVY